MSAWTIAAVAGIYALAYAMLVGEGILESRHIVPYLVFIGVCFFGSLAGRRIPENHILRIDAFMVPWGVPVITGVVAWLDLPVRPNMTSLVAPEVLFLPVGYLAAALAWGLRPESRSRCAIVGVYVVSLMTVLFAPSLFLFLQGLPLRLEPSALPWAYSRIRYMRKFWRFSRVHQRRCSFGSFRCSLVFRT